MDGRKKQQHCGITSGVALREAFLFRKGAEVRPSGLHREDRVLSFDARGGGDRMRLRIVVKQMVKHAGLQVRWDGGKGEGWR